MAADAKLNGDIDPAETREWLDALDGGARARGHRPRALPARAADRAGARGRRLPAVLGEHRLRQHHPARAAGSARPATSQLERAHPLPTCRWNAMAMVVRAQQARRRRSAATSRASRRSATLFDVGFNHFWHAPLRRPRRRPRLHPGPFLARRSMRAPSSRAASPSEQLDNFRQEVDGKGLSSLSASRG